MLTGSTIDKQLAWYGQPALNLHQFIAWVMLRDSLAVERIGDTAGLDASGSCSLRDPWQRHFIFGHEVYRVGERRRLDLVDAVTEARRHLRSGTLECTARKIGPDGHSRGPRITIAAAEWDSIEFNFSTGGAIDRAAGIEWADLRFAMVRVLELWPDISHCGGSSASSRLDPSLSAVAEQHQEAHRENDPWEEILADVLGIESHNEHLCGKLHPEDAWKIIGLERAGRTQKENERLGSAMSKIGFEKKQVRFGNNPVKSYVRGNREEAYRRIVVSADGRSAHLEGLR